MAGGKETPRQKMIGLMYLVLMTLLAMNVSKGVLKSFVKVNDGLEITKRNALQRNASLLNGLEGKVATKDSEKSREWLKLSTDLKKKTTDMINQIAQAKASVISATVADPSQTYIAKVGDYDTVLNLHYLPALDNYDVPTNVLGLAEPGNPKMEEGSALDLQKKLETYRDDLKATLEKAKAKVGKNDKPKVDQLINELDLVFNFDDVKQEDGAEWSWVADNFYHATIAATVTLMTKLEADLANTESTLLKFYYDQVGGTEVRVNKIEPTVITQSAYVVQGDSFRGRAVIAAFDTNQMPTVILAKDGLKRTPEGEIVYDEKGLPVMNSSDTTHVPGGIFRYRGDKPGDYQLEGIVQVVDGAGETQTYPFETSYKVAAPSATISPSALNVFYKGVENPLEVEASGFDKNDISVSGSGVSVRKTSKGWVVTTPKGSKAKTAKVSVSVKINGKTQNLGSKEFRLKSVPTPVIECNGKTDGKMSRAELSRSKIRANMGDFLLPATASIKSFEVVANIKGRNYIEKSAGSNFSSNQKNLINGLGKGQLVSIMNIKIKMPDGTVRPAKNPIVFQIK